MNTRLLIAISLLIIFTGLGLLILGLNPSSPKNLSQSPPPALEITPAATNSAMVGIEGQEVRVIKVIDGDTVEIEGAQTVRLLGIDTPETKDPRRPVGCFGKEASSKTKSLIEGKNCDFTKGYIPNR